MKQCTHSRRASRRSVPFGLTGILVAIVAGVFLSVAVSALAEHESDDYANDPQWLLTVTQDESSMEEAIGEFLSERTDWSVDEIYADDEETDLALVINFEPADAPAINIMIDTIVAAADDDQVYERAVQVFFYVVLPDSSKTPVAREEILELNNYHMATESTLNRIIIDEDGDLMFVTFINLPGPNVPVHAEQIYDAVCRLVIDWEAYYMAVGDEIEFE